jgi:hypothetical protein
MSDLYKPLSDDFTLPTVAQLGARNREDKGKHVPI